MTQSSISGFVHTDYKSLHASVAICATLVSTQMHTQTDTKTDSLRPLKLLAQTSNLKMVEYWLKLTKDLTCNKLTFSISNIYQNYRAT